MSSWRKHQKELITVSDLMRFNPQLNKIVLWVTPGGGKSGCPVIIGHHLIPVRGTRLAWITPRDNLRTQGETAFLDRRFRSLLGHNLEIRATEPEADPCRGTSGFITTYQSILADAKSNRHFQTEFRQHQYLLILDEVQHVAVASETHKALQPLIDLSNTLILMTGGIDRSDNERVAFLPYLPPDANGKCYVDFSNTENCRFITYDLREALRERAIIPMWFELLDGNAEWEKKGKEFKERISEAENGEIGSAIYTTLRTDFAFHLLKTTVEHWLAHKAFNRRALLLVVSPSIALAQKYLRWLRSMGVSKCDIAVSDNSKLAKDNIELFKQGKLEALVTVAMAYEGMDAPSATHIACLTHIRARPWIEQMLARATRYDEKDGPWEHQRAWIFAPDDKLFQQVMKDMEDIQRPFVQEVQPGIVCGGNGNGSPSPTTPIASNVDAVRGTALDPSEQVATHEHEEILNVMKVAGLYGIATEYQIKQAFAERDRQKAAQQQPEPPMPEPKPVSKREDDLRDKIKSWVNTNFYTGNNGDVLKEVNKEIMRRFGKSRSVMNERELQAVWDQRTIWAAKFLAVSK